MRPQPVPHRSLHLPRQNLLRWHPDGHRHTLPVVAGVPTTARRGVGMVDAAALRRGRFPELSRLPDLRLLGLVARRRLIRSATTLRRRHVEDSWAASGAATELAQPAAARHADGARHTHRLRTSMSAL